MLVPLIVAVAAATVYAIALRADYVFDDVSVLLMDDRLLDQQERVRVQWMRYLVEAYHDGVDNLYRPLTSFSYGLQALPYEDAHGIRSATAKASFRAVNLLLYVVVSIQVTLLVRRLARPSALGGDSSGHPQANVRSGGWHADLVALAAGLLFVAHPVHAEVVAGVVGRAELICALGFLGALLVLGSAIEQGLTAGRVAWFLFWLMVSIGGKEQGLVLPAVALAWWIAARRGGMPAADAAERRRWLGLVGATSLVMASYLLWRESILPMLWDRELLDWTIQPMRDATGADRWLMPFALAGRYLHLLLWPDTLAIDYGVNVITLPQDVGDVYLWLGFAAALAWVGAFAHAWRARWTAGLVMTLGFAFSYGVVGNLVTIIGTVFGERLIFLPSVFVVGYVVLLGQRLWALVPPVRSRGAAVCVTIVAVVIGSLGVVRTVTYLTHWEDRARLYAQQARTQPQSVRIRLLLADELRQRGRFAEAATAAREASLLRPDYHHTWLHRGYVAQEAGDLEQAIEYLEEAVRVRTIPLTVNALDRVRMLLREREEAEPE